MSYILRPNQVKTFDATKAALRSVRAALIVAGCGYGKGVIYAKIVEGAHAKGKNVLFIVYGKDRVNDFHERVTGLGIPHGVIMGSKKRERWHSTQIASVSTVVGMEHKPKADLIIIDEAHLASSPSFGKVLSCYPEAKIIGCTATPQLGNGRALGKKSGGIFEAMIKGPPNTELIRDGYLVGSKVIAPPSPKELEGLRKKSNGEADGDHGAAICDNADVIGDVVDHWKRYAADRKALSFGFNRKHAFDIAESFRMAGVNFAYVDANTPDGDIHTPGTRKFFWHNYDHGDLVGISSCETISIGWDHPVCKVLLLCSKTFSFPLFHQRLGRGSRAYKGYDHFRVHDHTANLYEFAEKGPFFESDIDWQLDGEPVKIKDKENQVRVKRCEVPVILPASGRPSYFRGEISKDKKWMLCCYHPFSPGPEFCPNCGLPVHKDTEEIKHGDGELGEVDKESLTKSLFKEAIELRKKERYIELRRIAARTLKKDGNPFSPNWANGMFRDQYGDWPKKKWKDEADELLAAEGIVEEDPLYV